MMLANTSTGSMATDAIAGERERGTFDMLRLSGTRTSAIILGKYAFIVLITMVILVMDALALAFGLWQFTPELFDIAAVQGAKNPVWFMSVLGCLFSMAILTSALYLALSASFEKSKQAASYSSMVQLVLSLLTYASNVVGAGLLAYVPIGNVWVVLGKALKGETTITYVACSMAIAVVFSAAALWYGTTILEKEMKK
jgi:sodium transport system permease protein